MMVIRTLHSGYNAIYETLKDTRVLEVIEERQVRIDAKYMQTLVKVCNEHKDKGEVADFRRIEEDARKALAKEAYERYKDIIANEIAYYM